MSGFFRCQVTIPMDSGQPEDSLVNVWHFDSDQSFADDADDVAARLITFYQTIDNLFQAPVSSPGVIKVYDLADAEPRTPGYETTFAITPGGVGSVAPEEMALALSFKAAPQSGVNPARLRGRVFLGPFSNDVLEVVSGRVRVTATSRQTILDAAEILATGPDAGDGRLAIFSPTTYAENGSNAAALPGAFNDAVELWMDNAPDTIRSRGAKPDSRISVTL